jgi:hypothetical protein
MGGIMPSDTIHATRQKKRKEKRDTDNRNKMYEGVPFKSNPHEHGGQNRHELGSLARHTKSKPEKRGVS